MWQTSPRSHRLTRVGALMIALAAGVSVVAQSPIENDDCQDAIPISDGTYSGTTEGATLDGSPSCDGTCVPCYPGGSGMAPDVWYRYRATCSGTLVVDTCGSEPHDSWLSLQEADCEGTQVACSEDDCGPANAPYQSRLTANVVAGEDYIVRVSGYYEPGYTDGIGPFELNVSCNPVADHCEDAVELGVPSIVRGSTEGADYDREADWSVLGFPRGRYTDAQWHCGRHEQDWTPRAQPPGVWYKVVGTGNRMTASVENPGTEVVPGLNVFCDGCSRPICVAGETESTEVTWCSRAGQDYLIWVRTIRSAYVGDFELSISDDGTPCYGAVDCVPVEVIDTFVKDNGDHDGWPDTHETADLGFTVTNRSATPVTGLVARLVSDDDRISCVAEREVHIGSLAPGETRLVSDAFTFRVGDADRTNSTVGENDEFAAEFRVSLASDQFSDLSPGFPQPGTAETTASFCSVTGSSCQNHTQCLGTDVCSDRRCSITGTSCRMNEDCNLDAGDYCLGRCSLSQLPCVYDTPLQCLDVLDYCVDESQALRIDLDLDASGGSGPTAFFEGFESGDFGAFSGDMDDNLDAGLSSLEASDHYRCQYNDPSTSGVARSLGSCFVGANAVHADAYFWQAYDRRSFSGLGSLYMGEEVEPGIFQAPAANLEAIRTTEPINLGVAVCSETIELHCALDEDCPPGEACRGVVPELSFKHQVSLMDDRWQNTRGHASLAHGVVQVQVAGADDASLGPWTTIEPKVNRYDSTPTLTYVYCFFDPVDDDSTEDDLFGYYGQVPPVGLIDQSYLSVRGWYVAHGEERRIYGPSSNCFPQRVFASAGDTDEPFDPVNLNGPVQGPGLEGALGPGTWVESLFSLDRYRGRRIRIRFLTSTFQYEDRTEKHFTEFLESPEDDGWWIDDVTITHTLMEPATVTADDKDNSALADDTDGDCVGINDDCRPNDGQLWARPGEVTQLHLSHSGGPGGTTTLTWGPPTTLGGTFMDFFVVIENAPTSCSELEVGADVSLTHTGTPFPGELHTFLVQAGNACGEGSLGLGSAGDPRTGCN